MNRMRNPVLYFSFVVLTLLGSCKEEEHLLDPDSIIIEGKLYKTVTIGGQTWLAENYAGTGGVLYDPSNSQPEYGKYYLKSELGSIPLPTGWRIPSLEDYRTLCTHHDIAIPSTIALSNSVKKLTSATNWNHAPGTNESGFNAHPAGYIFGNMAPIDGDIAEFWTSEGFTVSFQEAGAELTQQRITMYDSNNSPDYRFNVRLIKD